MGLDLVNNPSLGLVVLVGIFNLMMGCGLFYLLYQAFRVWKTSRKE